MKLFAASRTHRLYVSTQQYGTDAAKTKWDAMLWSPYCPIIYSSFISSTSQKFSALNRDKYNVNVKEQITVTYSQKTGRSPNSQKRVTSAQNADNVTKMVGKISFQRRFLTSTILVEFHYSALVTALPCYGALEIVVFDWLIDWFQFKIRLLWHWHWHSWG